MSNHKVFKIMAMSICLLLLLAACGKEEADSTQVPPDVTSPNTAEEISTPAPEQKDPDPEPVELTFYLQTLLGETDVERYINQFVRNKFPNVTWNVSPRAEGNTLRDRVLQNTTPDIVWEGVTNLPNFTSMDLPQDLDPLIKQFNFDLSVYDPRVIEAIQSYSEKQEMLYLPFNIFVFALHYNKDIFDKFSIPYPEDNMYWDEVIELSKRLYRVEDGVQYRGLDISYASRVGSQMSLSYTDENRNKAALQTDGWKRLFEFYHQVFTTGQFETASVMHGWKQFLDDRTLAMWTDILTLQNRDMAPYEEKGLNWDVVSYPTFRDNPGVGVGLFSDGFFLPKGSKNSEWAFRVMSYLSSDLEVQLEATRNGRVTGLNNPDIWAHAFENNAVAQNKNLKAIFDNQYPVPVRPSKYDSTAFTIVSGKLLEYVQDKNDVNTLLRIADEELNQAIAEMDISS